jgi:hypothetical protein
MSMFSLVIYNSEGFCYCVHEFSSQSNGVRMGNLGGLTNGAMECAFWI